MHWSLRSGGRRCRLRVCSYILHSASWRWWNKGWERQYAFPNRNTISSSHPLSPVSARVTNSESFFIVMKKNCNATLLKREIYLTLMKLFIQLSKKLSKKCHEMGKRYVQLQENKAFTREDPGFGGKRSYMYRCEPTCDLWHGLFTSIDIAWGHQTHISHFFNVQSADQVEEIWVAFTSSPPSNEMCVVGVGTVVAYFT